MPKPKPHSPGYIRYLIYQLVFPHDQDVWQDSIPFCQDLGNFIKNTNLHKRGPNIHRDLVNKGATHWKDQNGVTHRLFIEEAPRPRIWGVGHGIRTH